MNTKSDKADDAASAAVTLNLLSEIEADASISQRALSARLGTALGLTNALIKRCLRKGLMKISEAPARRFVYYLTPQGFQEKSRLVAEYVGFSLSFFRQTKGEYQDLLAECERRGWNRVALAGCSELAEIATIAALDSSVEIVAVFDERSNQESFAGLKVTNSFDGDDAVDAVIITDSRAPQQTAERLRALMGSDKVLSPPLLHVVNSRDVEHAN